MEKGQIFEENVNCIDLGTGYSLILLNKEEIIEDGNRKYRADVLRLQHPVTRDRIINQACEEEFPNGEQIAAIRKGIINPDDEDYIRLNEFVERLKRQINAIIYENSDIS